MSDRHAPDTDVRQHAHELLDQLGPGQLEAVAKLLEVILNPEESDRLSDEDRRAIAQSREYFRDNPDGGVLFEQVVAESGLTMDDIRNASPSENR